MSLLLGLCSADQHECEYGLCLDYDKVCNNELDCPNQSDELFCPGGKKFHMFP